MNNEWLLGFVEGEGCFSIGFIRQKDTRFGYQIKAMFVIKLTYSEEDVLKKIRNYLGGIGNIYFESNDLNRKKGMKNANDSALFMVTKREDLKKIIKLLEGQKFISKQKELDFKNWARCIRLLENREHLTKEGFFKIARLREQIHKRKQYNKQSFCQIRTSVEPCEIYLKTGKIPAVCEKCKECACEY